MHFKDSDWHSTEGDKRDDLSGNKWFKNSEMLAGNKKFIHNKAEWACERPPPISARSRAAGRVLAVRPCALGPPRPCGSRRSAPGWRAQVRAGR